MAVMAVVFFSGVAWAGEKEFVREVGVAKIDITPDFPVRLNGYYGRNAEATNAVQHIFAKALAIGSDKEGPAIIITIDNCIIPRMVREQVVERLIKKGAHRAVARGALRFPHAYRALPDGRGAQSVWDGYSGGGPGAHRPLHARVD